MEGIPAVLTAAATAGAAVASPEPCATMVARRTDAAATEEPSGATTDAAATHQSAATTDATTEPCTAMVESGRGPFAAIACAPHGVVSPADSADSGRAGHYQATAAITSGNVAAAGDTTKLIAAASLAPFASRCLVESTGTCVAATCFVAKHRARWIRARAGADRRRHVCVQ